MGKEKERKLMKRMKRNRLGASSAGAFVPNFTIKLIV